MSLPRRDTRPRNRAAGLARATWWSFAVALAVVVSQGFALAHLVLFSHTRCEHGALVHTLQRGGATHAAGTAHREAGFHQGASETGDPDHDHCDPFATPPALTTIAPPAPLAWLVRILPETRLRAREAERSVSILSFAPKTSPTA